MKSSGVAVALLLSVIQPYRLALPGYKYDFPRDHFSHPEFRTEWWYYTGNLRATDGRRFGFELTFFRHALEPALPDSANVWDIRDVWMAHLALSDLDGKRFLNTERLNRSASGLAGVDANRRLVWNGNWNIQWTNATDQHLRAVGDTFAYDFTLHSAKPPVIHGQNGVSQKSAGAGRASHYISLTRLETKGRLTLDGKQYDVEGLAWMDHEFFSHSMESNMAGWDWFSLQFDDGSELMLYRLRRKDGTIEPLSSGTYIEPSGRTRTLQLSDFSLQPGRRWTSPDTRAEYPVEWAVRVPGLGIDCRVTTRLDSQELTAKSASSPSYWEGAVEISGSRTGRGYLEMTGYNGVLKME
jgi:predicted secreted hydrolase